MSSTIRLTVMQLKPIAEAAHAKLTDLTIEQRTKAVQCLKDKQLKWNSTLLGRLFPKQKSDKQLLDQVLENEKSWHFEAYYTYGYYNRSLSKRISRFIKTLSNLPDETVIDVDLGFYEELTSIQA